MTESGKSVNDLVRQVAAGGELGRTVLSLWQRIRIDWSFASDRLAEAFRANRQLGARERGFVAETLYGLIRNLRRVDAALAAGGQKGRENAADRRRLLAYLVLEAGLSADEARRHDPSIDWTRAAAIDADIARERSAIRRIALGSSMPDWLAERFHSEYGADAEALAAALNRRAPMTIRANTLRGSREDLAARLEADGLQTRPGKYGESALVVESRTNLFALSSFREGRFEAQDEGSQLIAELVLPPPKGLVVDFCAGAGGKTLALAARMKNRGRIVATDVDVRKTRELRRRARRAGVDNAQVALLAPAPGAAFPAALERIEGKVQRVLVDAPCSGIGALRRNPEARWRLSPEDLSRFPRIQAEIAGRALALLAPGGRLIYATCTVFEAENEAVVERLLATSSDLELVTVKDLWGRDRAAELASADGRFLRTLPHVHDTDGFFAAVIRRRANA